MFDLFTIAVVCYVFAGLGVLAEFWSPASAEHFNDVDPLILIAAGIFFHSMNKILDYLEEIRDSLKKIANNE